MTIYQNIPVIMANFVPEMTNECSMPFTKTDTQFLALDVISLTNIDGNFSTSVTCKNPFLSVDCAP